MGAVGRTDFELSDDETVAEVRGNIIVAAYAIKGIISFMEDGFFPFIQYGRVMVTAQIGNAHARQVADSGVDIIVWVVEDGFAAIWHVLAERALKIKLFFPGALFRVVGGTHARGIVIGAAVESIAEHAVVVQAEAGYERAVVSL